MEHSMADLSGKTALVTGAALTIDGMSI